MAAREANLDASEFYHSALDNLMNSLQINSTPSSSATCCNKSFQGHFYSPNQSQFFSFCSTLKQYSKHKKGQNTNKMESNVDANKTPQQNVTDTPKRPLTTARKLKLFSIEMGMSPQCVSLQKAIERLEYKQHGQETSALNKKPMRRTSLRV